MSTATLEEWQRIGELVRETRIQLGFTNRKSFATACKVSERLVSDIEAGTRHNFSGRILTRLEQGLQWPAGTIDRLVADPGHTPPAATQGVDLVFKTPVFNQRPVLVDVGVVERSIAALTEAHRVWGKKPNPAEATVAAALVAHCWPYVTRLLEDNCLPGRELHPAVLPYFEAFTKLSDWVAPEDPTRHYAHWLIGDAGDVDDQTWQRYMQRWSESRRAQGRRGVDPAD